MSEEMEITLVSEPLRVPARKKTSSARTMTDTNLVVSFYFAKRGFENVARIIKR